MFKFRLLFLGISKSVENFMCIWWLWYAVLLDYIFQFWQLRIPVSIICTYRTTFSNSNSHILGQSLVLLVIYLQAKWRKNFAPMLFMWDLLTCSSMCLSGWLFGSDQPVCFFLIFEKIFFPNFYYYIVMTKIGFLIKYQIF